MGVGSGAGTGVVVGVVSGVGSGVGSDVGEGGGVGSGVGVGVGSGVGAGSGVDVGVGVGVGSAVGCGVGFGVGTKVGSTVGGAVGSDVTEDADVDIGFGVGVLLGWATAVGGVSRPHPGIKTNANRHNVPIPAINFLDLPISMSIQHLSTGKEPPPLPYGRLSWPPSAVPAQRNLPLPPLPLQSQRRQTSEPLITSSRVSSGTSCTTLVAAMISSRRVAPEIQTRRGQRNRKINRPHVNSTQHAQHFPIIEVQFHPTQLHQLRQLPQNNRRH